MDGLDFEETKPEYEEEERGSIPISRRCVYILESRLFFSIFFAV